MVEMLNGTKEKENSFKNSSVRVYDNVIGDDYPQHCHTKLEIIMPINNQYTVYCDKQKYSLSEGEILIISSGVPHRIIAPAFGRRLIILADLTPLYSMGEFENLVSYMSPVIHLTPENSAKICERLQKIIYSIASEYENDVIYRDTAIYTKLLSLLVLVCRNREAVVPVSEGNSSMQAEYSRLLLPVCDYINNHFNENITLDQVADLAGFSKYHFSRVFRRYADVSFYQYLNNKRIMQATKLLMETNLTIMEVAYQCGFSSISSFIRMFKIHKSCTPSEYKEAYTTRNNAM